MNRTIEYLITEKEDGLRIEQFLRRKGYSGQNLAEIKTYAKKYTGKWCPLLYAPGTDCRRHSKSHYL